MSDNDRGYYELRYRSSWGLLNPIAHDSPEDLPSEDEIDSVVEAPPLRPLDAVWARQGGRSGGFRKETKEELCLDVFKF